MKLNSIEEEFDFGIYNNSLEQGSDQPRAWKADIESNIEDKSLLRPYQPSSHIILHALPNFPAYLSSTYLSIPQR